MNNVTLLVKLTQRLSLRIPQFDPPGHGRPLPRPLLPRDLLLFRCTNARYLARMGIDIPNKHHRFVLIVSLKGSGGVCIDNGICVLKEGWCVLILPFQSHSYTDLPAKNLHWQFITFDHAPDARFEAARSVKPVRLDRNGLLILNALLSSWSRDKVPVSAPLYLSLLLQWHIQASIMSPRIDAIEYPDSSPANDAKLLARVNSYAFNNRHRVFLVRDLASDLGMSESYLRIQFRKMTGRSIGCHLREFRIKYACELLHDTSLRISEIAERCGYDSPFTFSRTFRAINHLSPSEYRKRLY